MCASQWVLNKPGGEMKVQGRRRSAALGIPVPSRAGRTGTRRVHLWKWRSLSAHVGTRKMVNYPRTGRGQRKLWWRSVAVLTCKSIVRSGSSGVRLIEPSG
ncbi:hypothetical protein JTE90_012440 [Oedothorax gibbosus]|uniref:Uncharacterized protein n=1 Tax=Oedothorax gibbosus TaxID=931172 RepID=A0AAV6TE87_9ARAC|nr:hypothetical protein JTE90_012440 [Oedothorax gibbosus]